MRAFAISFLVVPLALAACGQGGGSTGYRMGSVAPYHPVPGQQVYVPNLREDQSVVIDHFGDAHIIQH